MSTDYQPVVPPAVLRADFWTYQDAVEWLLDFYGRTAGVARDVRLARRAVDNAYRELALAGPWSYYNSYHIGLTEEACSTGTVSYTHATRIVQLTGGSWPVTAAFGMVKFRGVPYTVESRLSDSELRLREDANPGVDVAAGVRYVWYRDTYFLPPDFMRLNDPVIAQGGMGASGLVLLDAGDLHRHQRTGLGEPGEPVYYAITRDQRTTGHSIVFAPPPARAGNYIVRYLRAPRDLRIQEYRDGQITVTQGSANVTGVNTSWLAEYAGCVLRVSDNSVRKPTSSYGDIDGVYNPPFATRLVVSCTGSTDLTVDVPFSESRSGVLYTLSDPIDIDWQTCGNYFQRLMELQYAIASNDHLQRGYKLPQVERARQLARAVDGSRSLDVQPPPWLTGRSEVSVVSVRT